ncbi:uncharacterized protein si:ch211-286o17.1 isoform X1 [Silurus meridionalis]|uniref:Uncharacterized protein n=1 Tax=Silurus meridionalis TaxID=175797 RepID=A0A8T0BYN4_SILME|nr:uncharacterized protein si:ch211-286o17.1 isoform X1 [Silurus meridionalis]KAF7711543.1 hypothetical protein HF521_000554 [Silurus meridionalis]
MEMFNWKKTNCHIILALALVICADVLRGVNCQENTIAHAHTDDKLKTNVRGDGIPPTPEAAKLQEVNDFPIPTHSSYLDKNRADHKTIATPTISQPKRTSNAVFNLTKTSAVVCVAEAAVRDKDAVKLKLSTVSSCEENKAKIQSILEHLCVDGSKLKIYQKDHTKEMILSGECVEADVKGMTEKFDNDNIKDKVGILEAEPVIVNDSQTVFISILITGLLLAVLLIAAYILKTRHTEAKGACLAEEMFQVDEQNQGNTLLSVVPLPPQEPVEKHTSNGESLDSPPTNGHSTTQPPVADSEV